jgi:hypothetical protein
LVSEADYLCVGPDNELHEISNVGGNPIELLEFEFGP